MQPVQTPIDSSFKLSKVMESKPEEEMKTIPYRKAVRSVMYLTVSKRPHIAYTISVLSQFNNNPGEELDSN